MSASVHVRKRGGDELRTVLFERVGGALGRVAGAGLLLVAFEIDTRSVKALSVLSGATGTKST